MPEFESWVFAPSQEAPTHAAQLVITLEPYAAPEPPATFDDRFVLALYLEAEQAYLPDETPYDAGRGLQRFSVWLDEQEETDP